MSKDKIFEAFHEAVADWSGEDAVIASDGREIAQITINAFFPVLNCELSDRRVQAYFDLPERISHAKPVATGDVNALGIKTEVIFYCGEMRVETTADADNVYFYSPQFDIRDFLAVTHFVFQVCSSAERFATHYFSARSSDKFLEGKSRIVLSKTYERSRALREQAIKIHGLNCAACGMNFGERYGTLGTGFIHIHHIERVADAGERRVDPAIDLVPLCPNCHAMVHQKTPPLLPSELKLSP